MCGIAGFLSFNPTGLDIDRRARVLQSMGRAIQHRGPDDVKTFDDGQLALVFRRLSILDVQDGAQPFSSADQRWQVAVNGEIYNHLALRHELAARHTFHSRSDCEVVLHGWQRWGEALLPRLTGMFAVAVWDRHEARLTLARDRLGIKPLYVCERPDGVVFASELKALLAHPDVPKEADWHTLDRPLLSQRPDASYVHGVRQIPGGEVWTFDAKGRGSKRAWWSLQDHLGRAPFGDDARAYQDAYADLLEPVVAEHLQRDVGAALMLSGGLDSSLLAAVAARQGCALPCMTVVERTPLLGGDVEAARQLTERCALPWLPVRFDARTLVEETQFGLGRFEEAVWMMESPRFDLEWVYKSELHRAAKHHLPGLKVMLLGQGADEFAGGYSQRLDKRYPDWGSYLRDEVVPSLAQDRAVRDGGMGLMAQRLPEPGAQGSGYHAMMLLFTQQLQHHNLWHEDRSSSWHSLEARVPFLDHRLVELLASVPASLHERLFWRKSIVREAFRRHLPDVKLAPYKIGFTESEDASARDRVLRAIATASWPDFRQRYLDGQHSLFDVAKLQGLADAVAQRRPGWAVQTRQLLDCMAAAVFDAQLRGAVSPPAGPCGSPGLPVVQPAQWPVLLATLPDVARPDAPWSRGERLRVRPGLRVLAPLQRGEVQEFSVVSGESPVGSLQSGDEWVAAFFRHLGTDATSEFTVQDWIDELDVDPAAFLGLLNLLAFRGVVDGPVAEEAPRSVPAGEGQRRETFLVH